jgi:hypothetical protein
MILRAFIVNNMNAAKNKKHGYNKDKFLPYVKKDTLILDTYSLKDVQTVAELIKKEGINLLLLNGGDGTLQMTLTELLNHLPQERIPIILPLRGGTMNMVANNLGIRKSPVESARIVMEHIIKFNKGEEQLSTIPIKILKIRDAKRGTRYGFTFSNGIVYRVQKEYYATGNPSFQNAVNITTTVIGSFILGTQRGRSFFERIKTRILIDGKPYPYNTALLSVASVLQKLVLWFKPFYQPEKKGLDKFYFLTISMNSLAIIANIRPLSQGKLLHESMFNGTAHKVSIEAEGGYGIDGELTDNSYTDVIIEEGPTINFLVVPESIRTNMFGFKFRHWLNSQLIVNHTNPKNAFEK